MVRCVLVVVAACAALSVMAGSALGRGHLDRSFGDEGVVDLKTRPGQARGASLGAVQVGPERRIFFTERDARDRIFLRRYSARGKLNRGFGGDGRVEVGLTEGLSDLAIDSAGRPLVALQEGDGVVIKRFKAGGRPDRSFGVSGSVSIPCSCTLEELAVGAGNRPLVAASDEFRRPSPFRGVVWVMARLRSDGSPDRSLDGDGIVRHPMVGFSSPYVKLEPGGGALLYGSVCCREPSKPFMQRMSKDGDLQRRYAATTTRSLHGIYGTRQNDLRGWYEPTAVLRPNGRAELFWGAHRPSTAVRLLPSGKRDRSFGRRGVQTLNFNMSDAIADERGGTLVTGYGRRGYMVMRLRRDGRPDRRFGRVHLPRASNEWGVTILSHGPTGALVFDFGLPFCRQGCPAQPKLFRIVDPDA